MENNLENYIISNGGFLHKLASYYSSMTNYAVEYDDLYQVGCLALIEKYSNYNEEKGSLSNYSLWVIRSAMLNYINSNNTITHISIPLSAFLINVLKKISTFYITYGREMTDDELLDYIKENNFTSYKSDEKLLQKINILLKYHLNNKCSSIYESAFNYDLTEEDLNKDTLIKDHIKDDYNLEEDIVSKCFISDVIKALKDESKENIDIFVETLGLIDDIPKTRRELAEKYDVSCQAIDQRYKRILKKVKGEFYL